jgi:Mg-chelatase subunit ChlD
MASMMLRETVGRRRTCLAALALAVVAVVVSAASASAPRVAVTRVDTTQFPLVRVTLRMPTGAAKLPVRARENGRPITWQVTKGPVRQAIALSVDTSNSMKGARIAAVLKAAIAFVRQQPRSVPLGVYSFSAQVHPAAAIPTPHRVVVNTLRALAPAGPDGTALYASIVLASSDLSGVNATQRALIVVTDGQSVHDHSTLAKAIQAAQRARVSIYPVAIVTPVLDIKSLRRLATETGGQLSFARKSSDVDRLYRTLARKIAATRTYSYLSAAHSYQALHIVVSMKGHGSGRFLAQPAHPGSRPKPAANSGLSMTTLGAFLVAAVCLLFGLAFALTRIFNR